MVRPRGKDEEGGKGHGGQDPGGKLTSQSLLRRPFTSFILKIVAGEGIIVPSLKKISVYKMTLILLPD